MFNSLNPLDTIYFTSEERYKTRKAEQKRFMDMSTVSPHQPSPVNHQPELHFCFRQMVPPADLTEKAGRGRESDELPPNERVGREKSAPTVLSEHANIWGAFVGTLWEWQGCNEDTVLPVQAMQCLPPFTSPLKSNNDKTTTAFVSCGIYWVISQQRFAPLMYSCSEGGMN